ncbi:MAG TPA: guanitoxin biosynthesis L-enduracididine beta-hydroxylase GntD [Thermoanaerobaculia bacterium]|jgi:Fe(II)/alpha-ketoglutarate-dependent arginine beta-hydroxylase
MQKFKIDSEEVAAIQKLVAGITARYDSSEDPEFLMESTLLAHELPRRLRAALHSFKLAEPDSALFVISGYPVDDEKIGRTPEHWDLTAAQRRPTLEEEILFVLACSLLGECIGWSTQQGGRIIHDVMPVRGMEQEQIGIGSEQLITWHTEDAFHPLHGDYIGMMFLRNPDRVATTFASLAGLDLDPEDWRLLFEPHFTIQPDKSHRPENAANANSNGNGQGDGHLYDQIEKMWKEPEKIPLLSGDPRSPYIRIDPYFMDPAADTPKAQRAFEALVKALDARIGDLVLEPGDICFIDNMKAVHGRRAFKARYDGRDRWFKRTNITRDLRRSRAARPEATSRIIQ